MYRKVHSTFNQKYKIAEVSHKKSHFKERYNSTNWQEGIQILEAELKIGQKQVEEWISLIQKLKVGIYHNYC